MLLVIEKLSLFLLIVLVVFTPIFFGGVHVWAFSAMEFTVLILVVLTLIKMVLAEREVKWIAMPVTKLIITFVVYGIFQTLPLPKEVIEAITPGTTDLLEKFHLLFQREGESNFLSISLNPYESWLQILKLLSYFGVFFFIINQIQTRKQVNSIITAIILVGILEVIFGFFLLRVGSLRLGPFIFNSDLIRASGSYVSPNHFAGFLEMVILVSIGTLLTLYQRKNNGKISFQEEFSGYRGFLIIGIGIMLVGLLFTGSRGGVLGLFVGLGVLLVSFLRSKLKKFMILILSTAAFSAIFIGINMERKVIEGVDNHNQFFSQISTIGSDRITQYKSMVPIVSDFPFTGTGLGTFKNVFIRYKPDNIVKHFSHAHNDWLELLIETGIIGFALGITIVVIFFRLFIGKWRQTKDPFAHGMGAGVLGVSAAILTHGLVDFNLQIPANALLFSVFLGIGYSSINIEESHGVEVFNAPFKVVNGRLPIKLLILGFFLLIAVYLGQKILFQFLAEKNCKTQRNSTLISKQVPSIAQIKNGLKFSPTKSRCMIRLVKKYDVNKGLRPKEYFESYYAKKNIDILKKAIHFNPTSGRYYMLLGEEYLDLSQWNEDDSAKNLSLAIQSFENAQYLKIEGYKRKFELAIAWLEISQQSPNEGQRFSEMAFDLMQQALLLDPHKLIEALNAILDYVPEDDVINKIFPPPGTSTNIYSEDKFDDIRKLGIRWLDKHF